MTGTILIVKLLGLYFIVSGLFVVTQQRTLGLVLKDLFNHRALTFFIGVVLVIGGGALALRMGVGIDMTSFWLTVLGWTIVLKGILYIFAPDWMYRTVKGISRGAYTSMGVIIALIGLYLLFFLG